jgi:hypothetical protein
VKDPNSEARSVINREKEYYENFEKYFLECDIKKKYDIIDEGKEKKDDVDKTESLAPSSSFSSSNSFPFFTKPFPFSVFTYSSYFHSHITDVFDFCCRHVLLCPLKMREKVIPRYGLNRNEIVLKKKETSSVPDVNDKAVSKPDSSPDSSGQQTSDETTDSQPKSVSPSSTEPTSSDEPILDQPIVPSTDKWGTNNTSLASPSS